MKRIVLILLTTALIFAWSVSASAEIVYDENWFVDTFGDRLESFIGSFDATLGSAPQSKPSYKNTNSVSLNFYIDSNGKACVTYSVAIKETSTQKAEAEVYIEKKLLGPFWQKLNMKYTDSFYERYHMESFDFKVTENGTYRAVLNVQIGEDDIELKTVCDYEKGKLIGDVNLDGRITAADARLVLRYSARLEGDSVDIRRHGDINNDGKVTAYDARLLLKISAKQ